MHTYRSIDRSIKPPSSNVYIYIHIYVYTHAYRSIDQSIKPLIKRRIDIALLHRKPSSHFNLIRVGMVGMCRLRNCGLGLYFGTLAPALLRGWCVLLGAACT
jgi:hypothetical protein